MNQNQNSFVCPIMLHSAAGSAPLAREDGSLVSPSATASSSGTEPESPSVSSAHAEHQPASTEGQQLIPTVNNSKKQEDRSEKNIKQFSIIKNSSKGKLETRKESCWNT